MVAFFVQMFLFYLLGYSSCLSEFGLHNRVQVRAHVEELDNMGQSFRAKGTLVN